MKKVFIVIYVISLILTINCTSRGNFELLESKFNSNVTLNLERFQINIPTDSIGMHYYRRISTYYDGTVWYYIGFHKILNSLDLYNISDKKFVKRIMLDERGPNSITALKSIFIHNLDSIFINDANSLVVIDTAGIIKRKINSPEKELFKNNKLPFGIITSTLNFNITFLNKRKTVLFYFAPREFKYFSSKYIMTPFLGEISLNNSNPRISLLPVKYSNYYLSGENIGFGTEFQPNISVYKDLLIYNFPIESNIYTYNFCTGDIRKFGAKSSFSENLGEPFQGEQDESMHLLKNVIFLKTIYDPYKNLFYRLHWGNCEIMKNSTEFNALFDKPLYLMVFDQDFNLLKEVELENYKYLPYGYFVTEEGLFISTGHPMNKEFDFKNLQLELFVFKNEK